MIRICVNTHHGTPLPQPIVVQFDETGGHIGRADTNQLVLPDPERSISRVHAQVVYRAGVYAIVDQGSNAISVNGRPLGKGVEAPIRPGDQVQIGGYLLQVEAAGAAAQAAANPFADFAGLAPARPPAPVAPPAASAAAGLFGTAMPPPAQHLSTSGIPDDWDPFSTGTLNNPVPQAPAPGGGALGLNLGAAAPAALIPDLAPSASGGGSSIDQLFGLGGGSGGDPFAQSVLNQPLAAPNMAAHADPMQSLRTATPGQGQAAPDQMSDLHRPFLPPTAGAPVVPPPPPPPPPATAPAPAPLSGAVLSWNDGAAEGRTIIRAGGRPAEAAAPLMPPAPLIPPEPLFAPAPPPPAAPPAHAAPPPAMATAPAMHNPAVPTSPDALHAALKEGLGVPDLPLPPLSPELMRLLGQLLHEAARGTVDLLVARAALKREVRAEVTMIVAKENNPLKFSPTPEVALAHLLGPATRGFSAPQQAMRDAYDDLRAHQLAFLAGMRAALEGLLQRFDPAALEGRLSQKSMLTSLLPAARKSQLWGVFQQEYRQIAAEVADDFHQVFGREFLRAYEAQLDALRDTPR